MQGVFRVRRMHKEYLQRCVRGFIWFWAVERNCVPARDGFRRHARLLYKNTSESK